MQNPIFNPYMLLLGINLASFFFFGYDKWLARNQKRRIPERTLLLVSGLFGAAGATCGMYLFRHKTQKKKFYITVPIFLVLQVVILLLFV